MPPASQTPASGSPAPFDACALLSPSDLSKIVGGQAPVSRAIPGVGWAAGQCAWSNPTSAFLISVGTAASIQQDGDPAAQDAKAKLAAFKQRMSAIGTTKDIAGVGDGAVLGNTGMAARKAGIYLEVLRLKLTNEQLVQIVKLSVAKL